MTADTVGGVWTYAIELARALGAHGITVTLATMGREPSDAQRQEAGRIDSLELLASSYRLEWMENPWDDLDQAGEWLLQIEKRAAPDLIHLNQYAHGALPWSAPALMVGHSCVASWWRGVKGEDAPPEWSRYRKAVAGGLRAADLVVAPTRAMLAELVREYGAFPQRRVIPNGRDGSLLVPGVKSCYLLAAGRIWDEAKNIAALESVAGELSWPVYVAGEGGHPDAGDSGPAGLRSLGFLPPDQLAGWFRHAAIYVAPARYEPFGLSVLEAAIAGCALVLGDIPSLRENWDDAALFVGADDRDGLRRSLKRLIDDHTLRRELSARARARSLRFSAERMALEYIDAYAGLMAPREQGNEEEPKEEIRCVS